MSATIVIHIKDRQLDDVYIGRPGPWGNPIPLKSEASRDIVCDMHWTWLHSNDPRAVWVRTHIELLRGRRLACYCYPKRCHGDNFIRYLKENNHA